MPLNFHFPSVPHASGILVRLSGWALLSEDTLSLESEHVHSSALMAFSIATWHRIA